MPSEFRRQLRDRAVDPEGRAWVYVPYDQLTDAVGPLAERDPSELGIVMVESPARAARRPYHKAKLALVLANGRHFALEQAERGVAVRHVVSPGSFADGVASAAREVGPVTVMRPAERDLRHELEPLIARGDLREVVHSGWLTSSDEFAASQKKAPPYRMDAFYRAVRQRTGWLMEGGKPVGGRYSFDGDNREVWRGGHTPPRAPRFAQDAVANEVFELVATRFSAHPGELDPSAIPTGVEHAERFWAFVLEHCIEHFGPYEDAMTRDSRTLFHTRISSLLNIGRLLPERVCRDVLASDAPLNSVEGFVRQVLGWREFVHHVHEATDGFREIGREYGGVEVADGDTNEGDTNADGTDGATLRAPLDADGAAAPNVLKATTPLPLAYWTAESGLACLDHEVAGVWETGYGHHITRLMVLSNVATLLGVDPRELTDWFWVAYTDAYDWVVEPNVLGMGTFAVGELLTTKPYVSGAAYLDRMSDHCGACAFDPKRDCPLTNLYWDFIGRNRDVLAGNHRVAMPLRSWAKRDPGKVRHDAAVARLVRAKLAAGATIRPDDLTTPDSKRARLETAICELLVARGADKTVCPSEAARAVSPPVDGDESWRELMDETRLAARRLAADGALHFERRGEVVDPDEARGAVRLRWTSVAI